MKEFFYTVTDPVGIHARPAGLLAQTAKAFQSEILLEKGGKEVSAKRLIALMGLAVKCGDRVRVSISGEDEEAAAVALERYFKEHL